MLLRIFLLLCPLYLLAQVPNDWNHPHSYLKLGLKGKPRQLNELRDSSGVWLRTTYEWDSLGRILSAGRDGQVVQYQYDAKGRLSVEQQGAARASHHYYNAQQQRTYTQQQQDGFVWQIYYTYDEKGRLVRDSSTGKEPYRHRYYYHDSGQLAAYVTYYGRYLQDSVVYYYHKNQQLERKQTINKGFGYDNSDYWEYNEQGQVVHEWYRDYIEMEFHQKHFYNEIGQRIKTLSYTKDPTRAIEIIYTYDDKGNWLEMKQIAEPHNIVLKRREILYWNAN